MKVNQYITYNLSKKEYFNLHVRLICSLKEINLTEREKEVLACILQFVYKKHKNGSLVKDAVEASKIYENMIELSSSINMEEPTWRVYRTNLKKKGIFNSDGEIDKDFLKFPFNNEFLFYMKINIDD